MALPNDKLSTDPAPAPFLYNDDKTVTRFVDYEMGGIALNDPSSGLTHQVWTASIEGNRIFLHPENGDKTLIYTGTGIVTDISISFDQNMRLTYAYVEDNDCYLYWYDNTVGDYTRTNFGRLKTPRISLDDKRSESTGSSDIIFAYIKDAKLYYRQQRDRFGVERLLDDGPIIGLDRIGMNTVNRMQFLCKR